MIALKEIFGHQKVIFDIFVQKLTFQLGGGQYQFQKR